VCRGTAGCQRPPPDHVLLVCRLLILRMLDLLAAYPHAARHVHKLAPMRSPRFSPTSTRLLFVPYPTPTQPATCTSCPPWSEPSARGRVSSSIKLLVLKLLVFSQPRSPPCAQAVHHGASHRRARPLPTPVASSHPGQCAEVRAACWVLVEWIGLHGCRPHR
jgi:hypothetical protein